MLNIEVHDQAVQAALTALSERVTNMQPALRVIGEEITQRAEHRFESSTGPDGRSWLPKKHADSRKTLVGKTGRLRQQITASADRQALTVRAGTPYAAIHQFGGKIDRPAKQVTVRHRTDAKGNLLRSAIMNGKGLIFAKKSHKRALERSFEAKAHSIIIPARPFMPVKDDGTLYPAEQAEIMAQISAWLSTGKVA
ncbi:phage virion morphogenesis protein [Paucibacter sp. TC2R-5]|uniref:phage virion morphogenesis protein n=1 Tax=Paucibacter sp. TC2R-5 TaxID=2893555 RepID=UPI0021E44C5B|nr:phage virion morphogenesis protein [Paucibacter sp. TC2R-5]MCV2359639.1 phage virion morphogenesis protein [Paucibacter sp. TC2R-5]